MQRTVAFTYIPPIEVIRICIYKTCSGARKNHVRLPIVIETLLFTFVKADMTSSQVLLFRFCKAADFIGVGLIVY